jgi:hypothetical protein
MVTADGIGRASAGFADTIHGGNRVLAFNVESGEVVAAECNYSEFSDSGYPAWKNHTNIFTEPLEGGWRLSSRAMDDMLGYGNSISRTNEDRKGEVFGDAPRRNDCRGRGRVIAFDERLCVAYTFSPTREDFWNEGELHLEAYTAPKKQLWKSPPIEMIHDDVVLTPSYVYCVGHYRRVKGTPEIWVVSREDSRILGKTPVDGFPSFLGTSASGNRLFVSTREGKLICFEGE